MLPHPLHRSWLPTTATTTTAPPRVIIFMVHGYDNDISWTFQATPIFLAQKGFACFALNLQGHGHSGDLKAFVLDVNIAADDCLSFFTSIKNLPRFNGLPCFLYGESMGDAISLLIHFANLKAFRRAILVAPMCRICDKVKPRWPILPYSPNCSHNFFTIRDMGGEFPMVGERFVRVVVMMKVQGRGRSDLDSGLLLLDSECV